MAELTINIFFMHGIGIHTVNLQVEVVIQKCQEKSCENNFTQPEIPNWKHLLGNFTEWGGRFLPGRSAPCPLS